MLIKAILTGSVLSGLAFSIVYFGTEGADALDVDTAETVRVEETALAGAADVAVGRVDVETVIEDEVAVAEVEVQDPPAKTSEPKTKWLDQYLKKSKPDMKADSESKSEMMVKPDMMPESDMKSDPEMKSMENMTSEEMAAGSEDKSNDLVVKRIISKNGSAQATGTYVIEKTGHAETLDIDGDIDIEILKDQLGLDSGKNIQVKIIRKMDDGKSMTVLDTKTQRSTDYAPILAEAKKLLVIDMRNQAFLEIVDHAVDQGDMIQAADIVEELSTPELRDTARARIGTGLARGGKTEAAFSVLEEIEIDELSAPIRLEIITALMATKQERDAFTSQR